MKQKKVCKNLELIFWDKAKRMKANPTEKKHVNPAQWAWESYHSYVRNLDALGYTNSYDGKGYETAYHFWVTYIKPNYIAPKNTRDYTK